MIGPEKTQGIVDRARAEGFDLCGVAPAVRFVELERFAEWLAAGYAGEMHYLSDPRRADPRLALEGARSLIVVALNYNTRHRHTPAEVVDSSRLDPARGWISRYAWGDDYHQVMRDKLNRVVEAMHACFSEPFEARALVDSGPVNERVAAKYAGLGWLAKNTCLIHPELGSWLFLGVIVTTLELAPTLGAGAAPPRDLCGSCTRCLDACPTAAFPAPYVLDSRRCISYLTIELRGSIPEPLRETMGQAVIGCDICQDVCPWNRKAPFASLAEFEPRQVRLDPPLGQASLVWPELEWLASLSEEQYRRAFRRSAAKRAKWRGLVRNACVALGNARWNRGSPAHTRAIALLSRLAESSEALIAEHARWALERLEG